MKKTLRKVCLFCLALITALSFSAFLMMGTGCNNNSSSGQGGSTSFGVVQFAQKEVQMLVGDEQYVVATATDSSNSMVITYKSSNENIASVDEYGKVTANGKGTATITAKLGMYTATCKIIVSHGDLIPSLAIDNLVDNQIFIPKTTEYTLNPYVIFNGKKFTNAKFTYSFSGKNISVNSNTSVIKGLTKGSTELTVSATWDGVSGIGAMSKTIIVNVTNYIDIFVNQGQGVPSLFNMAIPTLNGSTATTVPFVVNAKDEKGDVDPSKISVSVLEGADYIEYSNGTVTSKGKIGDAKIRVSVTDFEGDVHVKDFAVPVEKALGDYVVAGEYVTVDFDTLTGNGLNYGSIFGENVTIVEAYHGKTPLTIKNNKIVAGLKGVAFGTPEATIITVCAEDRAYNVRVLPYVYKNAKTHTEKVEFSTYHGELPLEEIFGSKTKITQAYVQTADGEKELTISEDGYNVFGINSGSKPTEFTFAIATEKEMKYVELTAYTLIINKMEDFAYFTCLPGSVSYKPNQFTVFSGLDWDGYYVLGSDIDASTYQHYVHPVVTLENKTPGYEGTTVSGQGFYHQIWSQVNWGFSTFSANGANFWESKGAEWIGVAGKGLTGTLDGRGHTIYNYTPMQSGLVGFVNGGVVKNLGFKNAAIEYGTICAIAFNGATFENIYLETNPENTVNGQWEGTVFTSSQSSSVTMNNVFVNVTSKGSFGATHFGIFGKGSASSYGVNNKNVLVVVDKPSSAVYSSGQVSSIVNEAEYVDGKLYDGEGLILAGVRRYSSMEELIKDKSKNQQMFAELDSEYWSVLNGAVPIFTSCIQADSVDIYIEDQNTSTGTARVYQNQSNKLSVKYQGMDLKDVDKVTVVSGPATATGKNTVSGNATGVAVLKVTYTVGGKTTSKEITVNVLPAVVEYAEKLQFSAHEGKFLDENFNEVTIETIFGTNQAVDLFACYDGRNNELSFDSANGTIDGLVTDSKAPTETIIDLYTESEAIRVSVTAYTRVIREASDFEYFVFNQPFYYAKRDCPECGTVCSVSSTTCTNCGADISSASQRWFYEFGEGDFHFDGYYILANDIDMSEYVHNVENGQSKWGGLFGCFAWQKDYYGNAGFGTASNPEHGLVGTFDGNGHVLSNVKTQLGGLFGVINNGTVKNVAVIGYQAVNGQSGVFGESAIHGATFDNVYVNTSTEYDGVNKIGVLTADASTDVRVTNTIIECYDTYKGVATNGSVFGVFQRSAPAYKSQYQGFVDGAFKNVYVISKTPVVQQGWTSANPVYTTMWDGEYIDGVKNNTKHIRKIDGADVEFPTAVPGLRRYTSNLKMASDKNNIVTSGFNTNYWTIVNGLPKFTACMSNYVEVFLGDNQVQNGYVQIENGSSYDITLRIDGVALQGADFTASMLSGTTVTLEGKTIIANTVSEELSVLQVVSAENGTFIVEIDVVTPVTEYGEELYYSAMSGEFFKGDTKVELSTIFGKEVTLAKAYDIDGNVLTIGENNVVEGVATSALGLITNKLTLMTSDEAVAINVKVAGLIIDEAEDFNYLKADSDTYTWTNKGSTIIEFESEDALKIDDYCMLVKDIDASSLGEFDWMNGHTVHLDVHSGIARLDHFHAGYWKYDRTSLHGFMGTLDGNGHTISNLTTNGKNGGLLGHAVGAKIKNIGFVNCKTNDGAYGFLAYGAFNQTSFENVYVYSSDNVAGVKSAPLVGGLGFRVDFDNVVIVDNTSVSPMENATKMGSLSWDSQRWNASTNHPTYRDMFSNLYVVSNKPLSASVAENSTELVADIDARYVDGKQITLVANGVPNVTSGADRTVSGTKRYTSLDKMSADAQNNDFTSFDANLWQIVNGVPRFKSVDLSAMLKVSVNGTTVSGNYTAMTSDELTVGLVLDGAEHTANFTVTSSATDVASVNGNKITALKVGNSEITVDVGTKQLSFMLIVAMPDLAVDGEKIEDSISMRIASSKEIAAEFAGQTIDATVVLATESDLITINGATITANASKAGTATVTATITVKNVSANKTFDVIVETPQILVNGEEITDGKLNMLLNTDATISLTFAGEEITELITLTTESSLVEIEGATITSGNAIGKAEVTVSCDGMTLTISVDVRPEVTPITEEYIFSAHDGLFFKNGNVVELVDIIGEGEISSVADANDAPLTYENGAIYGLVGNKAGYVETTITVYTADAGYQIPVKVATLVIDQAQDLDYFIADSNVDYPRNPDGSVLSNQLQFSNADGIKWDGYYVLAKNIDATGYEHNINRDYSVNWRAYMPNQFEHLSNSGWYVNAVMHGFSGTLDGAGYTISNLITQGEGGLLGIILGGTIKNIGFVNCNTNNSSYGFVGYTVARNAVFSNIYISTPTGATGVRYTPFIAGVGHRQYQWTNVIIIDNTSDNYADGNQASSLTYDATRYGDYPATFGLANTAYAMPGLYVVSNKPLSSKANGTNYVASIDAKYVDGKEVTLTAGAGIANVAEGADLTVKGAYRYTSYEEFVKDAANRDFTSFGEDMWTMIGGIPVFNSIQGSVAFGVTANGNKVKDGKLGLTSSTSATIAFEYNGSTESDVKLEVVEGDAVTVDGATVTAGASLGSAVVKATYKNFSTTFEVEVTFPVEASKNTYTFSAYDGLFFNGDTVITLEDVIAQEGKEAGYTVTYITDKAGNVLTEDNGAIKGLTALDPEKPVDENVIVYTDKFTISLAVSAYTLIIDEASDIEYFEVKQNLLGNYHTFADGDFEWGGYYIMVKDIDLGYKPVRDFASGVTLNGSAPAGFHSKGLAGYDTELAENKGLTGTFDGQGHAIQNLAGCGDTSLFGIINGGTVKNVGLYIRNNTRYCDTCGVYGQSINASTCSGGCGVKPSATMAQYGLIASYVMNGGSVSDIYVYSDLDTSSYGETLLFDDATADSTFARFVIRYTQQRAVNGTDGPLVYKPAMLTQFTDSYFISEKGLVLHGDQGSRTFVKYTECTVCAGAGTENCEGCQGTGKVGTDVANNGVIFHTDAKYVNGEERTATENRYSTSVYWGSLGTNNYQLELSEDLTFNDSSTYTIVLAEGFRRYDTVQKFLADKDNIPNSPWTTWDRGIWDFTSTGTPII